MRRYVRPVFVGEDAEPQLHICEGRHPVLDALLDDPVVRALALLVTLDTGTATCAASGCHARCIRVRCACISCAISVWQHTSWQLPMGRGG